MGIFVCTISPQVHVENVMVNTLLVKAPAVSTRQDGVFTIDLYPAVLFCVKCMAVGTFKQVDS